MYLTGTVKDNFVTRINQADIYEEMTLINFFIFFFIILRQWNGSEPALMMACCICGWKATVLQIRRGIRDNLGIISHISP